MANKSDFASMVVQFATEFRSLATKLEDMHELYFDAGMNSGGSDPITNEDIAVVGITAAEVGDVMNFAEHLGTWLNGGDPFNADWSVTLNQVRNVNHLG